MTETNEPHEHVWVTTMASEWGMALAGDDDLVIDVRCACGTRPLDILQEMILTGDFSAAGWIDDFSAAGS